MVPQTSNRRSVEECIKAAEKILGVPVKFSGVWCGTFRVTHSIASDLPIVIIGAEFDSTFLKFSVEEQDVILQHEMGHIASTAQGKQWHTKANALNEFDMLFMDGIELQRLQFQREAEADFYATQQVGMEKMLRVLNNTLEVRYEMVRRSLNLLCYAYLSDYEEPR